MHKRFGKFVSMMLSALLASVLVLSLAAVLMPVSPTQANDDGNPVNGGNLEWAPIYLDGTHNKIVLTNCPETVSFEWFIGKLEPKLSRYAREGDDNVCFTVTLRNLDAVDHDLNFTWSGGDIADVDWTITPNPVTIPVGGTADVTFCCDLSNTTAYPASQLDDWYQWYVAKFDVSYDGLHAAYMHYYVCVLPSDGSVPVMPTVELPIVNFPGGPWFIRNMRLAPGSQSMEIVDFNFAECGILDRYDETAWAHVNYSQPYWEMKILDDGSVEFIAHATLEAFLSDVTWDRTWHLTHDDPYLQVTDAYTNTGTDPMSFSISSYFINSALEGAAIKVPGVHDEWTMFTAWDSKNTEYHPTIPPIMADDMAAPVIFECNATGSQTAEYIGAEVPSNFAAIVFPTEVPYYDSSGVLPFQTRRGTAVSIDRQTFSYRYDLAPGESKTLETYLVFTGSYPSSSYGPEEELYDVVYSLLSWPATAISLSPDQGVGAFTIEGQGFRWNSGITITWDGTPIPEASSSDWAGEFSAVVSVPEQTEPGNYTVTASDGTNSASATFAVPDITGPAGSTGPSGPKGDTGPSGSAGGTGLYIAAIVLAAIAVVASIYTLVMKK